MTTDTNRTDSTDRFSWHRVGMIARYYSQPLRRALILFPIISLVVGLASFFTYYYDLPSFIAGTLGTLLSFLYYWSPIIFNRVESSQITMSLPCRWSERATVVMLFAILGLPLLILGPSSLLTHIGQNLYPDSIEIGFSEFSAELGDFDSPLYQALISILMGLLPFSVALYAVLRSRKSRTLKAILLSTAALISETIILGIVMGIVVFRYAAEHAECRNFVNDDNPPFSFITDVTLYVAIAMGVLSLLFFAISIRRFKTVQI